MRKYLLLLALGFGTIVSFSQSPEIMIDEYQMPKLGVELLIAEKEFPEIDYTVMLADNWAPLKDQQLINQLTKPVRVVLCGAEYGVNVDYLNLARKTKGSVHLMEEDLMDLAAMHEGEVLKIGNRAFQIVKGEFKEIHDAVGDSIYTPRIL